MFVIAGPNGAGKTTFARVFLPTFADCSKFVNVDLIAGGLAPFEPQTAAIEAGKLMLRQIQDLARQKVSFGFETTLSGKTYVRFILAIQRVKDRIRQGGHSVPEVDIRRRFKRGLENLMKTYRFIVNDWQVYDNQADKPRLVAFGKADGDAYKDRDFYEVVKHLVEKK